ncbi:hypothetical protein G5714_000350 [Onychostoma macrolepis]|uniref:Uncharacterized protein n=1 Tax=Onychostoma macrolepis TaxID=369639 RepID=A0A7J6DGC4_9TELE|nr:hypothetical protein G5714_000350 [Onychostoma macrolepis]
MVWAISADRAAGVRGSRADSPPPVAHFPTPLYVPVFCSSLTRSTEIQQLVWSADSAGQLWILRFPKRLLNIVDVILCFVVRIKVSPFSYSASESSVTRTLTAQTSADPDQSLNLRTSGCHESREEHTDHL